MEASPRDQRIAQAEEKRRARECDLRVLREAVKASRYTYRDLASRAGKTAGWIGEVLRGNFPYRGGCFLPKGIRLALERCGFTVPESLVIF